MRAVPALLFLLVGACVTPQQRVWSDMSLNQKQATANGISKKCGLPRDRIRVSEDDLRLMPQPNDEYEKIDCLLAEIHRFSGIKMGFVGNEMDEDAVLPKSFNYIAGGTIPNLENLAVQVRSAGWIVQTFAKAEDGTGFLLFRTPDDATYRQIKPFMEKLFAHQLGDITFGAAPSKEGAFADE